MGKMGEKIQYFLSDMEASKNNSSSLPERIYCVRNSLSGNGRISLVD